MKALVKYAAGPGNMEIRDVDKPVPKAGQVLIEVAEAGICGSDLHIYHSDIAIPVRPPVVTGHEFSGTVTAVGEGVDASLVGKRVVSETAFEYCGHCDYCRAGYYNLCSQRRTLGYWFNGVFTNYTVVPAGRLHLIPDGVDFTSAAMTEPLACVCHALYDLVSIKPGDVALITGPGAIGLMAMQVARAFGAVTVISGTDIDADRLELARSLGADIAVNISKQDLKEIVDEATGGYGADVVLECSGTEAGIDSGLNLIKKRGYFAQIGLPGRKINFDVEKICFKELRFTGSLGSRRDSWEQALKLQCSGKVRLGELVSHKLPITEWKRAFELFESKQGVKLFLTPVE